MKTMRQKFSCSSGTALFRRLLLWNKPCRKRWKASMRNRSEGVAERRLLCDRNVHKTMSEKVVYGASYFFYVPQQLFPENPSLFPVTSVSPISPLLSVTKMSPRIIPIQQVYGMSPVLVGVNSITFSPSVKV